MVLHRSALALLLLLTPPLSAQVAKPRVLLIGDSISMGYTAGVRERLAALAHVERNPGNARHTGVGLDELDAWLGEEPWDLIHFNWGLHDLCYRALTEPRPQRKDKVDGTLEHTVEEYEANLRALLERLKRTGAELVFATTTPVPEGEPGRVAGSEVAYNEAARRVMDEAGVPVNDLHAFIAPRFAELATGPGNVHFGRHGSALLAGRVARVIAARLGLGVVDPGVLGRWTGSGRGGVEETMTFYEDGVLSWTIAGPDARLTTRALFDLDPAPDPMLLDLGPFDGGPLEGRLLYGIASVEGDSLILEFEPGPPEEGGDAARPADWSNEEDRTAYQRD